MKSKLSIIFSFILGVCVTIPFNYIHPSDVKRVNSLTGIEIIDESDYIIFKQLEENWTDWMFVYKIRTSKEKINKLLNYIGSNYIHPLPIDPTKIRYYNNIEEFVSCDVKQGFYAERDSTDKNGQYEFFLIDTVSNEIFIFSVQI